MYRAANWLALEREMLETKADGKNLLELTSFRNIALWWFVRDRLYHPTISHPLIKSLITNTYFVSLVDFLYDFVTSISCKMLLRCFEAKIRRKRQLKVLITAQNVEWKSIPDLVGRLKKSDAFFDSIIAELKRRDYDIDTVYPLGYSLSGLRIFLDKLKIQEDVIHKPFNAYWSMGTWKRTHDARRHFRNIWRSTLEKDRKLIYLLEAHGLRNELSYCFNFVFERIVKNIEMAEKLVEEEEPDLILLTNEYGIFERALVVAGKLKGIPSLAIQHGLIGPLDTGYIYSEGSISESGNIETPYCPVPDKIAVYGQFYYDLLTKASAFPPDKIVITGQPRYDILAISGRVYNRKKFCDSLGLDPDRKIVLVATQPIPEREILVRSILRGLRNFPEVQVIIKPHPTENTDVYKSIIGEENVRVRTLFGSSDTFEALYACDLLVAAFSTVITEALVLGKFVVTINLRAEDPAPHYKKYTLRVNREQDLEQAIRKALYDEKTRETLRKAGKEFAFDHSFRQDGKATERVVSLVEQMIKRENTRHGTSKKEN